MANFILQELPKGMGDGKQKIYPKMLTYTRFDYDKVIEKIHDVSPSFSTGNIRGVLDAFVQALEVWLPMGHTMKVDGLGVFSMSLEFADGKTAEQDGVFEGTGEQKTEYRHVHAKTVNFRVDKKLIDSINAEATFDRIMPGVKRAPKSKYTKEQRLKRTLNLIDKLGYITLDDYASLNEVSRAAASNDLKQFTADTSSEITYRGNGTHKTWIRKSVK